MTSISTGSLNFPFFTPKSGVYSLETGFYADKLRQRMSVKHTNIFLVFRIIYILKIIARRCNNMNNACKSKNCMKYDNAISGLRQELFFKQCIHINSLIFNMLHNTKICVSDYFNKSKQN